MSENKNNTKVVIMAFAATVLICLIAMGVFIFSNLPK